MSLKLFFVRFNEKELRSHIDENAPYPTRSDEKKEKNYFRNSPFFFFLSCHTHFIPNFKLIITNSIVL